MFKQFSKTRPPLPPALEALHLVTYKVNRDGSSPASSLSQKMERWLHRQIAADLAGANGTRATLEIGAGTLNQLDYEPAVGPYDIVEPFTDLYRHAPNLARVRSVYADIAALPAGLRYERITSSATLEHLCDLPTVIAHAGLRLAPGGEMRVSIPSEGTPLWGLGWRLTTGLEFRLRHGLDYGLLIRHEHVNTAREIEMVLRHVFRNVSCRVFGVSRWLSLYQFYACRDPDLGRCRELLRLASLRPGSLNPAAACEARPTAR